MDDLPASSGVIVLLGAAVLAAVFFVWQGYGLFASWRGDGVDSARLALRAGASADSTMGLEQVATVHLFGEPASAPPPEPVQTDMPRTDLKLVLVGAMTNSDASKASALIAADGQTKRFYVGDSIASGVVLQEVHADSIVLKRNGKLETLTFPRAGDGDSSPVSAYGYRPLGRPVVQPSAVQPQIPVGNIRVNR